MKRKRGAQPGNLNALKHGFYSKQFEAVEIQDLDTMILDGLQDEVAMLRVIIRRILELTKGCDDLEELMNVLGVLGMAATQLAGLLRVQHLLGGDENSEIARTISQAISNVSKEMGLHL